MELPRFRVGISGGGPAPLVVGREDGAAAAVAVRTDRAVEVDLVVAGTRDDLLGLVSWGADRLAGLDIAAGAVSLEGVPPSGELLGRAEETAPPMPGVTSRVILADERWGPTLAGFVDGRWAGGEQVAAVGRGGTVELAGGVPQLCDLLAGRTVVGAGVEDGTIKGDMAGLSQLKWMLEQPGWAPAAAHLGPLLRSIAVVLRALRADPGAGAAYEEAIVAA